MDTAKTIRIEKFSSAMIEELNVSAWPIWEKEVSVFDWHYDQQEQCYLLEGEVTVRTEQGEVSFRAGDFVTFPAGLTCTWIVKKPVRKHYRFG